jgi:hypothetical protein
MSASIQIRGIDQALQKLGSVATADMLLPPMQRAVLRLQRDMAEYPPQPPRRPGKRNYIRGYGFEGGPATSEHLGQRWTIKVTRHPNGLTGKVGNNASYAPLVQHDSRFPKPHQTLKHQSTGWITDTLAMNRNERAITADFEAALKRATA